MIAFIFPGQGSQKVGMGHTLAETYPEARETFEHADAALAEPLSHLCFHGPEEQLTLTENAQPAILAMSVAVCRVLASRGVTPQLVAGHSLGEYSANVVAGTLPFAEALRLVRRRGRYMQEAVPVGQGAMAAILGLDLSAVQQACEEAAEGQVVSPANINGAGQIVIAGHAAAVERASARAKVLGARRTIPLPVSAPFHCALMKPAQDRLEPELHAVHAADPSVPVVANVDADLKSTAAGTIDALVRQVSAPVRWEDVVNRLTASGVTVFIEVGPGKVLSGLVRKINKTATAWSVGTPEDVEALMRELAGADSRA